MRYSYGVNDSFNPKRGRTISVPQLASIIKRDVSFGKWNTYHGGVEDNSTASCSYKANSFVFHERLFIYGTEREFKELEELIAPFIPVTPRKFN